MYEGKREMEISPYSQGKYWRFIVTDLLKSAYTARTIVSRMDMAVDFHIHRSAVCGGPLKSSDWNEEALKGAPMSTKVPGAAGNRLHSEDLVSPYPSPKCWMWQRSFGLCWEHLWISATGIKLSLEPSAHQGSLLEKNKLKFLCLSQVTATWKDQLDILWLCPQQGYLSEGHRNTDYFMVSVD